MLLNFRRVNRPSTKESLDPSYGRALRLRPLLQTVGHHYALEWTAYYGSGQCSDGVRAMFMIRAISATTSGWSAATSVASP